MNPLRGAAILAALLWGLTASAQVIEFESNGQKYQTLTRSGVTIMFTPLTDCIHTYGVVQVSVANGSAGPYVIRPEDFTFQRTSGGALQAAHADSVVQLLYQKGGKGDVLTLVKAYETALYGAPNVHSTNGYEERRQAALLSGSARVRAAGAASALALVQTKLAPGQSTDGAVFFPTACRPLGPGRLVARTNTDVFQFNIE
jgi:hypothetical protein